MARDCPNCGATESVHDVTAPTGPPGMNHDEVVLDSFCLKCNASL